MITISTNTVKYVLNGLPDSCPFCHKSITPNILNGYGYSAGLQIVQVPMYCPNTDCNSLFIAYYIVVSGDGKHNGQANYIGKVSTGNVKGKSFESAVTTMSPTFEKIYNQAYAAQQGNLFEICGVGYRKALEFLIKDYAILNDSSKQEEIEKSLLGKVIDKYVSDPNIKSVAKRAAWLGNDETHYIRKWEGKNLKDLITLIDLTVHWIQMEALTKSFEDEMPE